MSSLLYCCKPCALQLYSDQQREFMYKVCEDMCTPPPIPRPMEEWPILAGGALAVAVPFHINKEFVHACEAVNVVLQAIVANPPARTWKTHPGVREKWHQQKQHIPATRHPSQARAGECVCEFLNAALDVPLVSGTE
jgi:hypothetical protein